MRDLIALWEVGVEVVLPREHGPRRDLATERQPELHDPLDRDAVRHGERPGEAEADGARLGVLPRAEAGGTAAEHLRPRLQLDVDLEADDGLPRHLSHSWAVARGARPEGTVLCTALESVVPRAAAAVGGAGLRAAEADGGQVRERVSGAAPGRGRGRARARVRDRRGRACSRRRGGRSAGCPPEGPRRARRGR